MPASAAPSHARGAGMSPPLPIICESIAALARSVQPPKPNIEASIPHMFPGVQQLGMVNRPIAWMLGQRGSPSDCLEQALPMMEVPQVLVASSAQQGVMKPIVIGEASQVIEPHLTEVDGDPAIGAAEPAPPRLAVPDVPPLPPLPATSAS